MAPRISVIIPALNEASWIGGAIASAAAACVEILIVDGGSTDGTAGVAASLGADVLRSHPPRARQMNAGARAASGDALLFLHADARLPSGFEALTREALADPEVAVGAFSLSIDGGAPGLRRVERGANWRARRLGMPYGDQALFMERPVFEALGGYPELPIMEDFEFVRRARRHGRVVVLPQPVCVSARRWQRLGVRRTTWINQRIVLGYLAGLPPERLARWYDRAGALEPESGASPAEAPTPRPGLPRPRQP